MCESEKRGAVNGDRDGKDVLCWNSSVPEDKESGTLTSKQLQYYID